MYTNQRRCFPMVKAMYINSCRYDFVDSQGKFIFSFKSPVSQPLTFLDIRKLQLASMLKGSWCLSIEEIPIYLSKLHQLDSDEIGQIVTFFELFDTNSKKFIYDLPIDIWKLLHSNFCCNPINFLIDNLEENVLLTHSIRKFCNLWRTFEWQGVYTLYDLIQLTESDLLKFRGIGPKRVKIIKELLAQKGLCLKEEA